MKKPALIIVIIILIAIGIFFGTKLDQKTSSEKNVVKLKGIEINAEIADNLVKREVGLMYRDNLPENGGMLFVFPKANDYAFWMKNTKIPLDIIWINEQKQVVHVSRKVPTCESQDPEQQSCPSYRSYHSVKYVLEMNAGWAETHNIIIGDILEY